MPPILFLERGGGGKEIMLKRFLRMPAPKEMFHALIELFLMLIVWAGMQNRPWSLCDRCPLQKRLGDTCIYIRNSIQRLPVFRYTQKNNPDLSGFLRLN